MIVFTQPDVRFRGRAYEYVRAADGLPTIDQLTDEDPVCRVKLVLPVGRWTYYIAAVTCYGEETVMTGFCVSPLGSDCEEWGDASLDRVAALRTPFGLPPERDVHFEPMRLSEIRQQPQETGTAP